MCAESLPGLYALVVAAVMLLVDLVAAEEVASDVTATVPSVAVTTCYNVDEINNTLASRSPHTYIHTHTSPYTHTNTSPYTHTHTHPLKRIITHTRTHTHARKITHTHSSPYIVSVYNKKYACPNCSRKGIFLLTCSMAAVIANTIARFSVV